MAIVAAFKTGVTSLKVFMVAHYTMMSRNYTLSDLQTEYMSNNSNQKNLHFRIRIFRSVTPTDRNGTRSLTSLSDLVANLIILNLSISFDIIQEKSSDIYEASIESSHE